MATAPLMCATSSWQPAPAAAAAAAPAPCAAALAARASGRPQLRCRATDFHQSQLTATERAAGEAPPPLPLLSVREAEDDDELQAAAWLRAFSFYRYPEERKFAAEVSGDEGKSRGIM